MVRTPRTHSGSGKSPVTIDLDAAESAATDPKDERLEETAGAAGQEKPGPEPAEDPPADEPREEQPDAAFPVATEPVPPKRRSGGLVLAALAGGLIGIGGAALLDRYVPDGPADTMAGQMESEIGLLRADLARLVESNAAAEAATQERAERIDGAIEELRAALAEVREAGTGGEGETLAGLEQRLAELGTRIDALSEGAPADPAFTQRLDAVEAGIAELRDTGSAAAVALERQEAAAGEMTRRLTEISTQLDSGPGPEVARAIAAAALKSAVERGAPFAVELDSYASLAPDRDEIAELRAMAANGIPTRSRIVAELPSVVSAMVAEVTAADPDAGVLGRLLASLRSLIKVRPVGEIEGNSPFARIARIEVAIRDNEYGRALGEFAELPEPVRQAGAAYFAQVEARARADELVEVALAGALASGE